MLLKTSDLHLILVDFNKKKRIVLKNCVTNYLKIFLTKLCGISNTRRKESSVFTKILQIKLLTLSAAK